MTPQYNIILYSIMLSKFIMAWEKVKCKTLHIDGSLLDKDIDKRKFK